MLKVWDSSGTIPIDGVVHPSHPSHQPTCIAFLHRQELIQLQEALQEGHWATDILELKELVTTTILTVSGELLSKAVLHENKAHITLKINSHHQLQYLCVLPIYSPPTHIHITLVYRLLQVHPWRLSHSLKMM